MELLHIVSLVVLGFLFFLKVILKGDYVSDDMALPKGKKSEANILKRTALAFWGVKYHDAREAYIMTVSLHIINSILVYLLFRNYCNSFILALCFLFHPALLQGGIWISGKGYSRCAMFSMLGLLFSSIGAAFFMCAAPFIPVMFFWAMFLFTPHPENITLALPVAILIATYYYFSSWREDKKKCTTPEMREMSFRKLIIGFKTFSYYTHLIILPLKIGMYHTHLWMFGVHKEKDKGYYRKDYWFYSGIVLLVGFIAFAFFDILGLRMALVWYLSTILVFCSFFGFYQMAIGERYAYLPAIGLLAGLAHILPKEILLVYLGYLVCRSYIQLPMFFSNWNWLEYNVAKMNHHDCHFPHMLLGVELENRAKHYPALERYYKAWTLRPFDDKVNFHLALCMAKVGNLDVALDHIKTAQENIIPLDVEHSIVEYYPQLRSEIEALIAARDKDKPKVEEVVVLSGATTQEKLS